MASTPKTSVQPIWICDPRDDRCVRPVEPTFLPGISVRHSPSCTGDICALFACDGGNWRVTNENTLDRARWIEGWIITQLLTRGFVDCEEHPLQQRGGGWWADAFRAASTGRSRFRSGSKLWALKWRRGGATNDLLLQAKDYAYEALQYLETWGIVSELQIDAQFITRAITGVGIPGAVIHLKISIRGPGVASAFTLEGMAMPDASWLWQEYMPPSAIRSTSGRLYGRVQRMLGGP